jgi:RNA polymerase sigma-70 factor (ECF subfamily)
VRADLELLEAWRQGDARAGRELLDRYFAALKGFFTGKTADVEDLMQRTLSAVMRSGRAVRIHTSMRAYVFTVARRELYASIERSHREEERISAAEAIAEQQAPSPTSVLAHREEQRLLLRALRRIPMELQIALELHYWEELSTSELAEVLGLPQGTVKTRLRRARQLLQAEIEALAGSPELLDSTVGDLEGWARSVRPGTGSS